jgi:uncharacterized protein YjbJ (UPF0337 family)
MKDMSKDRIQDGKEQFKDAVKQRWGALTDKELDTINSKPDQLAVLLQARYGYTKEQAEKEMDQFLSNMNPEGKNPVEVVLETLSNSTPEEEAHVREKVDNE